MSHQETLPTGGDNESSIGSQLRDFAPLDHDRDEYLPLRRDETGFRVQLSGVLPSTNICPGAFVDVQLDMEGPFPMFILGQIPAGETKYASAPSQIDTADGEPTVQLSESRVANLGIETDHYVDDDPLLLYPVAMDDVVALLVVDFESSYTREQARRTEVESARKSVEVPPGHSFDELMHTADVMDVDVEALATALRDIADHLPPAGTSGGSGLSVAHRFVGDGRVGLLVGNGLWDVQPIHNNLPDSVSVEAVKFAHEQAVRGAAGEADQGQLYRRDHGIYSAIVLPAQSQ